MRFTINVFIIGTMLLMAAAGFVKSNRQAVALGSTPDQIAKLSIPELKYRLRDKFEDKIHFCGPPVVMSHIDTGRQADQFSGIVKDNEEFQAILSHNNLPDSGPWNDRQKHIVIKEHNILSNIRLLPVRKKYKFSLLIPNHHDADIDRAEEKVAVQNAPQLPKNMLLIQGFIAQEGKITISNKKPVFHECPQ